MLFDRDAFLDTIKNDAEKDDVELLSVSDENIVIFDNMEGKEITFTMEEYINPAFIEKKISLSSAAKEIISYSPGYIASILFKNLSPEYFMTLNKLFIVATEKDIEALEEDLVGEYCGYYDNINDLCGIMLFEYNCVVVNVGAISSVSNEVFAGYDSGYIQSDIIRGFWSTIFHEFRHLMLDTNIYLPEDKYPVNLSAEEAVEEFGNQLMETMKY